MSAAPHARTLPASASVVYAPVYTPSAFRWPTLIWTEAWSLAVMSLLVHELWGGWRGGAGEFWVRVRKWRAIGGGRRGPPAPP